MIALLLQFFVAFLCIFVAGMNLSAWQAEGSRKFLYFTLVLTALGLINLFSLVKISMGMCL